MNDLKLAAVLVFAFASSAAAQGAAPSAPPPVAKGKLEACRDDVVTRKLRGPERTDAMQVCLAEGRLDCVKQAVAQKVPLTDRKAFLKTCMSGAALKTKNEDDEEL